jgi:hypothetical protein
VIIARALWGLFGLGGVVLGVAIAFQGLDFFLPGLVCAVGGGAVLGHVLSGA